MTTSNKIMWKRGEIAPKKQFLLFSTLFYIYISNFRSPITYSFVKCGCSIYCFPLSTLICRSTDISKCFSESLGIRDNESRLYFLVVHKNNSVLATPLLYLPTIKSSRCLAVGLTLLHTSMVKTVLALLKIDVSELIIADSMTAISKPRAPV